MQKCPNCERDIKGFHPTCPHCGHQLLTPEKVQGALAALDSIKDFVVNLDMSPEGIETTAVYIDNVTSFLRTYQELLFQFMEEHRLALTRVAANDLLALDIQLEAAADL